MATKGQIRVATDQQNHDGRTLSILNDANDQLEGRVILTLFSLMVEIENELVSERIKEGLRQSSWSVRVGKPAPSWTAREG